jgi:ribosome-binding ATPase YchF (GTP1/OBG family)
MKLAILGLPSAGKTTIFNALTGQSLATGIPHSPGKTEVHTGVADVPDDRLTALSALFHPRKTIAAKVTYADIGGLQAKVGREGLPGALVNQLGQMDGFVHVVRAFEDEAVPHPMESVDPARDLAAMEAEFLLNDQLTVERRLERLAEERQKVMRDRTVVEREQALFERIRDVLEAERPLRSETFSPEEHRLLSGFGLLTRVPMLVIVNLSEGAPPPPLSSPGAGTALLDLQGRLEMEIAQLPPEERRAYLEEYGLTESGRRRVLRASYELLGLISFFTVGEDEVRAWTLRRGGTALEAADTIHSDLARGFIRAEVIPSGELLRLGGLAEARSEGLLRQEGKDYVVVDGEVVHIKFNV